MNAVYHISTAAGVFLVHEPENIGSFWALLVMLGLDDLVDASSEEE